MRARIGELGGGEAVVQAMGSFSADAQLQQSGASPGIVYNIIVTRDFASLVIRPKRAFMPCERFPTVGESAWHWPLRRTSLAVRLSGHLTAPSFS